MQPLASSLVAGVAMMILAMTPWGPLWLHLACVAVVLAVCVRVVLVFLHNVKGAW